MCSGNVLAAQQIVINCNYCSDTTKLSTITQYTEAGLNQGQYKFTVVDMGFLNFSEFNVSVPQQSNPVFGQPSQNVEIDKIQRPNQKSLENLLDEAKGFYEQAQSQLSGDFIVLPPTPYRSAYDALQYRGDFNSYITNYTNNELNAVVSLMKQGQAAIEQLSASLQVGVSALVSASVSLQRDLTGRVQFSDGTYIKIKIKVTQDVVNGLELQLDMTSQAYSADGKLLPKNELELSNFNASGTTFHSGAFSSYLSSQGIAVNGLSGGGFGLGGGGSCETDWSCNASGTECVLNVRSC